MDLRATPAPPFARPARAPPTRPARLLRPPRASPPPAPTRLSSDESRVSIMIPLTLRATDDRDVRLMRPGGSGRGAGAGGRPRRRRRAGAAGTTEGPARPPGGGARGRADAAAGREGRRQAA